jgi:hypothetical protein
MPIRSLCVNTFMNTTCCAGILFRFTIGFDKHEIKKIFKKFYRVGDVDHMAAKGSGLGLPLVQILACIHLGPRPPAKDADRAPASP